MKDYQKESILFALETMEKHIAETQETIAQISMDKRYGTTIGESVATYAARLSGYILERRGYCYALSTLGYRVKWDGEHAVDIAEEQP